MRTTLRFSILVVMLALGALVTPAEAVYYLCGDICCVSVSCARSCIDDFGNLTTCQQYGVCYGSPECTGFAVNAVADLAAITSPRVCTEAADDVRAPVLAPVPTQATD
ncbi:MAG TPA: hypothetical protein VGG03_17685 [Thermoanaerobaculia bacterium]|jgi:hypothetical protein